MGKTTEKRSSSTKNDGKSKNEKARNEEDEEEDVVSDAENSANEDEETTREDTQQNETNQSDQSKSKSKIRPSKIRKINKSTIGRKVRAIGKLEVKEILTHTTSTCKRRYKVRLQDDSTIWISAQRSRALCPDLIHAYVDELNNGTRVEAIISHKRDKKNWVQYLIKWKDESKGETWEKHSTALLVCPNLLSEYVEKVEKEDAEAHAVLAITEHKLEKNGSRYLVKWKDTSKGETWETAIRCIALCPEILDQFTLKNPECVPKIKKKTQYVSYSNKNLDIEFDGRKNWEVGRILKVCVRKNKTREFLIEWMGYRSDYNSWEPEKNLNCPDLIEDFMAAQNTKPKKVVPEKPKPKPKAKTSRPVRKPSKPAIRLTLKTDTKKKSRGKRLSVKRNGRK